MTENKNPQKIENPIDSPIKTKSEIMEFKKELQDIISESRPADFRRPLRKTRKEMSLMTPLDRLFIKRAQDRENSIRYGARKKKKMKDLEERLPTLQTELDSIKRANEYMEIELLEKLEADDREDLLEELEDRKYKVKDDSCKANRNVLEEKEKTITDLTKQLETIDVEILAAVTQSARSTNKSQKCRTKQKLIMVTLELQTTKTEIDVKMEKAIGVILKDLSEKAGVESALQ